MSIQLSGLDQLLRQLNNYTTDSLNKVDQALADTADAIVADAKNLAPVDSGELRDSIRKEKDGKNQYVVGTDVPYALFVELGTRKKAARPFLFPASEANRTKFIDRISNAFKL